MVIICLAYCYFISKVHPWADENMKNSKIIKFPVNTNEISMQVITIPAK